jgi:hypothetical protein
VILVEKELSIDATKAARAEKFDDGRPYPEHWKRVDFIVDDGDRILLIELTDPSHSMPGASASEREKQRRKFMQGLLSKVLLKDELAPKAFHSYLYRHMMEADGKPFVLVALLGISELKLDRALLGPLLSALEAEVRKAGGVAWRRQFVRNCVIATDENWNQLFPDLPLSRKRSSASPT